MIKSWKARRTARREGRQAVVLGYLLQYGEQTGTQLQQRTGMRFVPLFTALQELEAQGRVTSRWQGGPYPRPRLYRAAFRRSHTVLVTCKQHPDQHELAEDCDSAYVAAIR